jgi:cell division protease FtsH
MEHKLRRLNSQNNTVRDPELLGINDEKEEQERIFTLEDLFNRTDVPKVRTRIILNKNMFSQFQNTFNSNNEENEEDDDSYYETKKKKSENFEVITKFPVKFADIGGYQKIKNELKQCIDILTNHTKYDRFNVRVPKGLILEGPPGNGKTLLAKGLAGEAGIGFIPVSGSEFQEKYVGVGSSRVRELFNLAKKNKPCIIFIDEIDAIGRHRSSDGESSSSERDNTLNELLVALDGFKNSSGIFVIGATNRVDLLDPALIRPGRIDKRIFIGSPDAATREAILRIHTQGKPYDETVVINDLVDLTMGLSGAQIENVLNEAMLNALREDRTVMTYSDIDHILNRIMAGWQPNDHQFTTDIIDHIAIHEMGHALVGLLCKHHSKMSRVIINLSSPKSPAYTVFEGSMETIYTRQALFEHLMILLAGRIAEEVFYDITVTTGAINDFEEAFKLAEKMIVYYGMGKTVIYPNTSEKYKEIIDTEVVGLINEAYAHSMFLIQNAKDLLYEGAEILKRDKLVKAEDMIAIIEEKYPAILNLKFRR